MELFLVAMARLFKNKQKKKKKTQNLDETSCSYIEQVFYGK